MAEDLGNIIEQMKTMLSGEGGKEALSGIVSMLSSGGEGTVKSEEKTEDSGSLSSLFPGMDIEKMAKLASAYQGIKNKKDDRSNLLAAIRPYLSAKRAERLDGAMKIVEFTNLGSVAKELDLF